MNLSWFPQPRPRCVVLGCLGRLRFERYEAVGLVEPLEVHGHMEALIWTRVNQAAEDGV